MTDYDALAAELAAVKAECADLIAGKEYQAMQHTLGEVNARLEEAERWIKQSRGDYPNAARYVDEQIRRQDEVCNAIDAARAADSASVCSHDWEQQDFYLRCRKCEAIEDVTASADDAQEG